MLNRRILRVKAFQNLYAYDQCKTSNLSLAKDQINDAFLPDLNSMEVQDKGKLRKEAAIAISLFVKNLNSDTFISEGDYSQKILNEAKKGINLFHKANQKDQDFLLKNMISSAERIPQLYLYAIELLIAFGEYVSLESERKKRHTTETVNFSDGDLNLSKNVVLQKIKDSPIYQAALIRNHVNLNEIELEIKDWFREYIRPFEGYQEYIKIAQPSAEDDYNVLDALLKKVLFKTDTLLSFFADKDLNWTENKSVVRSLAAKVLKNVFESPDLDGEVLPEIAINWEDDKEFFQNIFILTAQSDDENREMIAQKTQNWDIERIAQTDKVIISMALTEMKNFPSIPVKVSINEYIDISKTYSTPKSKQFVNGLLDVLSKELTENGKIRKSGRGLLDNK